MACGDGMFLEILRNISILLSFCMVYSLLFRSRNPESVSGHVLLGIIFGVAAVLAMLSPVDLFPGVSVDSRSVFISLAGLFGGVTAVVIASAIALVCRAILGGIGMMIGFGIILSSGAIGLGYRHLRRRNTAGIGNLQFWLFGLVVHVVMVGLLFALPVGIRGEVIRTVDFSVLLIYPIGTVLAGRLLSIQNEQGRSKRMILDNQERLQSILRTVPAGIGMLKGRVFTDVNPFFCELTGYSRDELIGRDTRPLYSTEEEYRRAGEERIRQLKKGGMVSLESQWIRKDGEIRYVLIYYSPLEPNNPDDGGTFAVLDMTERLRAEKRMRQLMQAIEQSAEMVVITDADATIQYVNSAFEEVTGYSREEVVGHNPRILQSGRQTKAFYESMWAELEAGKSWHGRLVNRRKDGSLYTEESTISPVCDDAGRIVSYVGAKRNVTRELELEDQLRHAQKMESIGQLAGGIAHDFNNLLQVIGGQAELTLMDAQEGTPEFAALNEIQTASFRGKKLVSQLLAFSRRQVIQPVDLCLNRVVEEHLKMIRGLLGEHIKLEFIPEPSLATVHADRGLMEQVLMNLCVNARDAMPEGGLLTVETHNRFVDEGYIDRHPWSAAGPHVVLCVTDSGLGMSPQMQEHIFEPFFTTKAVGKGTGLGLSTVFGIVKQHGGHVEVYSEPGKGSSFKIYLPAVDQAPEEIHEPESEEVVGGDETLLVAEDDESVLQLATRVLSASGYTVLQARDGEEAVQVFEQHMDVIDGLVLDVVMPKMSGKEALDCILEKRPGLPHLFASGYSENAIHTNFIKQDGLNLLNKPYRSAELLQQVRGMLDHPPAEKDRDQPK